MTVPCTWIVALSVAAAAAASGPAAAATQYINLTAPAFAGHNSSFHNDGVAPDACEAEAPLDIGEENRGDLQNATGSFIASVVLPESATITRFTLFANDADADINSTAYLMRKLIEDDLSPAKSGIVTMAEASTAGAVIDTMRAFSDNSIQGAKVANSRYVYFVELVNCGTTVEPFAAQIRISTP